MSMVDDASTSFDEWVRPHLLAMYRLAARLVSVPDADDVVQTSLLRAWDKRDQYDEKRGTASQWLLAIVVDQSRAARRSHARRADVIGQVPPTAGAASGSEDLAVRRLDIEAALNTLTRRQRVAIELHYFVGLTLEETAQVMGVRLGTAKSTIFDARARLRALLGAFDD